MYTRIIFSSQQTASWTIVEGKYAHKYAQAHTYTHTHADNIEFGRLIILAV